MPRAIILVACFLACFNPIYPASAPFIKKCSGTDSKCIKSSAQAAIPIFAKGIPELGVETMDPLFLKSLDGSSPNLKLHLQDITASGLSQCRMKKIQLSPAKDKLSVKLQCDVDARGQYELDGKLLVLPIKGKGNAHVILSKAVIDVEAAIGDVTGSDGVTHWKIGKWNHSYELKDKATVELDNLFEGNEALGRAAQDLLKSAPNEIIVEVGPPIIKAVCAKIVKNVNEMFSKIPKSELVD